MLMPSIFGEDMFDEFMRGFPFFDNSAENNVEKKLYGHNAKNVLKTDIKELEGVEVAILCTPTRSVEKYAKENNIQIKTKQLSKELTEVEINSAKAQLYPTLSFSTSHSLSFQNSTTYNDYNEASNKTNYSGNYNLNSGITLYSGSKITNTIKQQNLLGKASEYNLLQSIMEVEISITQAYLKELDNSLVDEAMEVLL